MSGLIGYAVTGTPLNPMAFPTLGVTGRIRLFVRIVIWAIFMLLVAFPVGMLLFSALEGFKGHQDAARFSKYYESAVAQNLTDIIEDYKKEYASTIAIDFWSESSRVLSTQQYMGSVAHIAMFWIACILIRFGWWVLSWTVGSIIWRELSPTSRVRYAWWFWRPDAIRTQYYATVAIFGKDE